MSAAETLRRLEALAHRHLNFSGTLHQDTSIAGELAPDSLARLTLLVEVENAFLTCIEDDEALQLHTVGDLVALLTARAQRAEPQTSGIDVAAGDTAGREPEAAAARPPAGDGARPTQVASGTTPAAQEPTHQVGGAGDPPPPPPRPPSAGGSAAHAGRYATPAASAPPAAL